MIIVWVYFLLTVNDAQWRRDGDGPLHSVSCSAASTDTTDIYQGYHSILFPLPPQIMQVLEKEPIFRSLPIRAGLMTKWVVSWYRHLGVFLQSLLSTFPVTAVAAGGYLHCLSGIWSIQWSMVNCKIGVKCEERIIANSIVTHDNIRKWCRAHWPNWPHLNVTKLRIWLFQIQPAGHHVQHRQAQRWSRQAAGSQVRWCLSLANCS